MNTSTPTHRKRPIAIEARQFTGSLDNATELMDWAADSGTEPWQPGDTPTGPVSASFDTINDEVVITGLKVRTLEGVMAASVGDWIVRGVAGEFYPVKPDIFEATYEALRPAELADEEMLTRPDRVALRRFDSPNFAVKDARGEGAEALRLHFRRAALAILLASEPTKSRAVALTELETAMMWAIKAYYGAPGEGDGA